jgi:hypothetical protein
LNANGMDSRAEGKAVYESPSMEKLGFFHVETRNGCFLGKQWSGQDGWGAIIGIPISNCSG